MKTKIIKEDINLTEPKKRHQFKGKRIILPGDYDLIIPAPEDITPHMIEHAEKLMK